MKILITGAAGFIGSHLCEALLGMGHEVTGIDNLSTGRAENIAGLKNNPLFRFVKDDVSSRSIMDGLVSSADCIYHLAASVGVKLFMEEPSIAIMNNVYSAMNVLLLASKYNKKMFFASSSEVYGEAKDSALKEDNNLSLGAPPILRWGYGCTKALGEYYALSYYKKSGTGIVIARFFNVCGPRQTGSYGMVIPRFVAAALKGEPIYVFGDGSQVRSFTYITDAVSAVISLMDEPRAIGEIFNVGNPGSVTILELAEMIKRLTGSNSPIKFIPYHEVYGEGFSDMRYRAPDISKITELIGFKPRVGLPEMLQLIIDYWKDAVPGKKPKTKNI